MKSFSTLATQNQRMTKTDKNILLQAKNLVQSNSYFREHQDANVYIHRKNNQPYLLPDKMPVKEAKEKGFETMMNTVQLSSILSGKAKFGNR